MLTFKKLFILLALLLMTTSPHAQTDSAEQIAAKIPLQNYIKAHETGNPEFIRRAFTADAKIVGHMAGQLITWGTEEYAARFSGKPAEDESARIRSIEIISITGDAAIGKVTLNYPTVQFTDYMSILKIAGEWKIVSKSFNAQAKKSTN
jgi:Putative lumazine-binding